MIEPEIFDSGFVWTPRNSCYGVPDESRCRAAVPDSFGVGSHQCFSKVKVHRLVKFSNRAATAPPEEIGYCNIHDPLKVKQKCEARDAKWKAEWAAKTAQSNRRTALDSYRTACARAIEQIAAGHNDARGLAMEIMKGKPE